MFAYLRQLDRLQRVGLAIHFMAVATLLTPKQNFL